MNQAEILLLLDAHNGFDEVESGHLKRTRDFVADHASFYDKRYAAGHVTASAWIVNPQRDKVLLTHHRKLDRWFQLGGHLEGDRSLLDGARREALEESGLRNIVDLADGIFDIDVHPIPAKGDQPAHFHYDVRYAFVADPDAPLVISAESRALRWVALHDVMHLSDEVSLQRMIAKTRAGWI